MTVCTTLPHDYLVYIHTTPEDEQLFVTLDDGREGLYDWDLNLVIVPDPSHVTPDKIAPYIEA